MHNYVVANTNTSGSSTGGANSSKYTESHGAGSSNYSDSIIGHSSRHTGATMMPAYEGSPAQESGFRVGFWSGIFVGPYLKHHDGHQSSSTLS